MFVPMFVLLTIKDWCHMNNILQVHIWGYLVVKAMFHAPMTSSMMSLCHKVGQILKLIYINIWARASIKSSKYRKCWWLYFWYIEHPLSLYLKRFVASSKWRPFKKKWNMKHSFNLTSDMRRKSPSMQKSTFHDDDIIDDVTGWPQSRSSIYLSKWNKNIFHDKWRTNKDII